MEELTKRFAELVRRELGATEVLIAEASDPVTSGALCIELGDGRRVEARFEENAEIEVQSTTRRLEILVRAFESVLIEEDPSPKKRDPISISLREELRALVMRCEAIDALVIDAHSPVVWASASRGITENPSAPLPEEARAALRLVRQSYQGVLVALSRPADADDLPTPPPSSVHADGPSLALVPPPDLDTPWESPPANESNEATTKRAVEEVRGLPQMATLYRGGHLAVSLREERFGYVVRSFAGIYALVMVFDVLFDEIRIERALRDSLPRIERLVLALPPLDPDPVPAGVVALRPRRRR